MMDYSLANPEKVLRIIKDYLRDNKLEGRLNLKSETQGEEGYEHYRVDFDITLNYNSDCKIDDLLTKIDYEFQN